MRLSRFFDLSLGKGICSKSGRVILHEYTVMSEPAHRTCSLWLYYWRRKRGKCVVAVSSGHHVSPFMLTSIGLSEQYGNVVQCYCHCKTLICWYIMIYSSLMMPCDKDCFNLQCKLGFMRVHGFLLLWQHMPIQQIGVPELIMYSTSDSTFVWERDRVRERASIAYIPSPQFIFVSYCLNKKNPTYF